MAEITPDGKVWVYRGYAWDGASGIAIDTKTNMRGSLFHDILYQMMRERIISYIYKDLVDRLLQIICLEDGMMRIRARSYYSAVRRFGFRHAWPFLLTFLLSPPLFSEQVTWTASNPGHVLGDLGIQLYQGGSPIADPGITLVAHPNGRDYTLNDLPDAAVGDDTYELTWTIDGILYVYRWPHETRTPQAITYSQNYQLPSDPMNMAKGDTLPNVSITVSGLSSDPTGSTVTFTLATYPAGVNKVDAAVGSLNSISQNVDLSWQATATYSWNPADTDTAGSYRGFFTITFPVSNCGPSGTEDCVMSWPADRSIRINVYD